MNIQNLTNINFLGKVTNNKAQSATQLPAAKPDTFERTTKPSNDDVELAKMYGKMKPLKLDEKSLNIIVEDNLDVEKVQTLMKNMQTNKTTNLYLRRDPFDSENNYVMKAVHGDKAANLKLLDKNLNVMVQENREVKYGKNKKPVTKRVMTQDFRTNTFNDVKFEFDEKYGQPTVTKQEKIRRDEQGLLIRKEFYEKSEIPGMYNVKYEFPNGKSRQLSKVTVDKKTGHTLIEKDMRSADMTRTQYRYEDDPNGNRITDYKVTDANGKVLMKQSQTFEKLGENKFRSTRNGKAYQVELTDKSIDVTDEGANEVTQIPLEGFVKGDEKKITGMLKRIPGDELINMANTVVNVEEIPDRLDSYCQTQIYETGVPGEMITAGTLAVSDDMFVFLHELGHATDSDGKPVELVMDEKGEEVIDLKIKDAMNNDKDFVKTYNEERKNFLKEFPTTERNYIDYFIEEEAVEGQKDRGRKETIAETNALLNTYQTVDMLGMRTQYLQQHFPKTIAYLSELLTPTK